jgi:hypothetical protein
MTGARQAAYLEAMGIPLWVRKGAVPESGEPLSGLRLGPGSGRFLLLCSGDGESAGELAADIARALPEQPVWAWPATEQPGRSVQEVIDEHLFTDMLVFGADPARKVFGDAIPEVLGPMRVLMVPGMDELSSEASARRALWRSLCENALVPEQ